MGSNLRPWGSAATLEGTVAIARAVVGEVGHADSLAEKDPGSLMLCKASGTAGCEGYWNTGASGPKGGESSIQGELIHV